LFLFQLLLITALTHHTGCHWNLNIILKWGNFLAKKAYILDPYNKMAFTVKTQAKIAQQWQHFINDANNFF